MLYQLCVSLANPTLKIADKGFGVRRNPSHVMNTVGRGAVIWSQVESDIDENLWQSKGLLANDGAISTYRD